MDVFHLGLSLYARQLSGEGAKLYGGRWNQVGVPCLYAAGSKSLCVLEYAANVLLEDMPEDLSFTTYFLPEVDWAAFEPGDLPSNWMETPASNTLKEWGTKRLQKHLVLKVPSVVIPTEFNFIINPLHPEFKKVRIKDVTPFTFDRRIKK